MSDSNLQSLFVNLSLSTTANHALTKILGQIDNGLVSSWLEKIQIKDGRVVGTFYSDLGARLSFNDFKSVYEALGYDFGDLAVWQDWWCYGAEGCKRQYGYTCDPSACP